MTVLNGLKIGCLLIVACAATAITAPAQTFRTLVEFDGTNGAFPYYMSLTQGTDGNLYGATEQGGADNNCDWYYKCGIAFRLTRDGRTQMIYDFCTRVDCFDGLFPFVGVVEAVDGGLYGTTWEGGVHSCDRQGCGTIYKLTGEGTLTTLHSFDGADGLDPVGLIQATDSDLYGAATGGGAGYGTVFKISSGGRFSTLHRFTFTEGTYPNGVIQASDGDFYGTAYSGGTGECNNNGNQPGCGTVFRMTPDGKVTTLHSFNGTDGEYPASGLIQATDGNFYGTTNGFGEGAVCEGDCGTVFKITPRGTVTTLHTFTGGTDGFYPLSGLIQATDGNFYGTTEGGKNSPCGNDERCGTVFRITPDGELTTLHSFNYTDGTSPYGGLFQATDGKIYGTTIGGGALDLGTIFSLDVGLKPFVAFLRNAGEVGQTGPILGQGFTGTTSVSINGIEANFTVVSDTHIRATVPEGATTGFVKVVTPSGVLTSNVPFRVIQ